jgi:hypothetical protein
MCDMHFRYLPDSFGGEDVEALRDRLDGDAAGTMQPFPCG